MVPNRAVHLPERRHPAIDGKFFTRCANFFLDHRPDYDTLHRRLRHDEHRHPDGELIPHVDLLVQEHGPAHFRRRTPESSQFHKLEHGVEIREFHDEFVIFDASHIPRDRGQPGTARTRTAQRLLGRMIASRRESTATKAITTSVLVTSVDGCGRLSGICRGFKKMWTNRKVLVDYSSRMGNRPDTRCARPLSVEMPGPRFRRV